MLLLQAVAAITSATAIKILFIDLLNLRIVNIYIYLYCPWFVLSFLDIYEPHLVVEHRVGLYVERVATLGTEGELRW